MATNDDVRDALLEVNDHDLYRVLDCWLDQLRAVEGQEVADKAKFQIGYTVIATESCRSYFSMAQLGDAEGPDAKYAWDMPNMGVHRVVIKQYDRNEVFDEIIMGIARSAYPCLPVDGGMVVSTDDTGLWHRALIELIQRQAVS